MWKPERSCARDRSASLFRSRLDDDNGRLSAEQGGTRDQLSELVDAAVHRDPIATQRVLAMTRPIVLRYCRARIGRLDRSFVSADDVWGSRSRPTPPACSDRHGPAGTA
ncbi:hypothetical protein KUTG_02403 [Kutzneria sp. 744]|nr:hypothetical protein KUTG_02403 [Kutzneria sp. 744]